MNINRMAAGDLLDSVVWSLSPESHGSQHPRDMEWPKDGSMCLHYFASLRGNSCNLRSGDPASTFLNRP
jgi:hypothetical protein